MTEIEKRDMVKAMSGENDDAILTTYLKLAGDKILRRAFPFDPSQIYVPTQYESLQCEIAVYLINKRGAEGQTGHSENGISRSYESADVPESMLRNVLPFVGLVAKGG